MNKKRIICLILVVVMLALSLVGCGGYSYADDDLSKYASFDYANGKADFLAALQNLIIDEGDFTENDAIRADKVYDAMYAAIASASSDNATDNKGVIGAHDMFYYSYYLTYKDGEKTVYLAPDYMRDGKTVKIQLGKKDATELQKAIYAQITEGYDLTGKAYAPITTGKAIAGEIAYISYVCSYDVVGDDGKVTSTSVTVTRQRVVLDANDPIHVKLIANLESEEGKEELVRKGGVDIGTEFKEDIVIPAEVGYVLKGEKINKEIKVTKAKIEFVEEAGKELCTFDDNSYVEAADKVAFKDIYGQDVDVKGKVVTYHVYPVKYSKVEELDATNIINLIYGKNFDEATAKKVIFGAGLAEKADMTEEEKKAAEEKLNAAIAEFKLVVSDTETKDFATAVKDLNTALSSFATKDKALDDAKTNLEKAEKALSEVDKEDAENKALAEKNVEDCKAAVTKAEEELKLATTKRDDDVSAFIAVKLGDKTVEEIIEEGYENVTYDQLQTAYRQEIKEQLALEIMKLIKNKVVVSTYPSDLVDEVYDQLYNEYQYNFYKTNYKNEDGKEVTDEKGNKVTNYSYYKGSFRDYLCAAMGVEKYKEAREQLRADAQTLIKPVLQYSFVASQLDKVYTNEEFEEYEENSSSMRELLELYYGYSDEQIDEYYKNARNALQLDKLLNYLLETDETVNGKKITDTYKNIKFAKN